jgi:hypothetical protein
MTYEEKTLDLQIYQLGVTTVLTVAAYLYVAGVIPANGGIIGSSSAIICGGVVGGVVITLSHRKYLPRNNS